MRVIIGSRSAGVKSCGQKGSTLDDANLDMWVRFGHVAMRGEKRFVITHSEIFPGTFASTMENHRLSCRPAWVDQEASVHLSAPHPCTS